MCTVRCGDRLLGYFWVVKIWSAKLWSSFHCVGGVFLGSQNSKCQVLANFSFSGGWGGGGVFFGSQNSKCQVLAKFSFSGGGGGAGSGQLFIGGGEVFLGSENSKYQVLANFSLGGGRASLLLKNRVFLAKWAKYSGSLACCCITDSLSHTTCVETN